eukprot:4756814-Prymnesium_polylepis.1
MAAPPRARCLQPPSPKGLYPVPGHADRRDGVPHTRTPRAARACTDPRAPRPRRDVPLRTLHKTLYKLSPWRYKDVVQSIKYIRPPLPQDALRG